jgi:preprotein translocase subunit SecD
MAAVQSKIENRVNKYGVTEPIIHVLKPNRILVQLPDVKNINDAMNLIGQVALLEFKEQALDPTGAVIKDASGNPTWVPALRLALMV